MSIPKISNPAVRKETRFLFLGSAILFLINNFFGFDNALTVGEIPRWQVLIHLHAGSIGWITLSAIGLAIWLFTGDRKADDAYARGVRNLARAGVFVFGGYIITFGLAFSRAEGPLVTLLPIFGTASALTIWWAAIFSLSQLRRQSPVTTPHILITGALLVAAVGGTMGVLLGLERALGPFLPPMQDRVGFHAGMMDTYLFLVAAAVVETFIVKGTATRWSWPGLLQGATWTLAAVLVPIGFLFNLLDQLLPIFGILLLLAMLVFLIRMGWRALVNGPRGEGPLPWTFFGTLWLVVYLAFFRYAVMGTGGDFALLPSWFFAVFAHAGFVGMMTNLILAVFSARTQESRHVLSWGEPTSLWLINLGLLVFFALKITADIRLGAIVMGIGVVLGVLTMILRLRAVDVAKT